MLENRKKRKCEMWRFCICSTKVCSFACAMLDVCANDCNSGARGIAVPKRWVSWHLEPAGSISAGVHRLFGEVREL